MIIFWDIPLLINHGLIHPGLTLDIDRNICIELLGFAPFPPQIPQVEAGSILRGSATHWRLGRPAPWRETWGFTWGVHRDFRCFKMI